MKFFVFEAELHVGMISFREGMVLKKIEDSVCVCVCVRVCVCVCALSCYVRDVGRRRGECVLALTDARKGESKLLIRTVETILH